MSVQAVFIGMPGAGKTTVGKQVAQALGVAFRDSDDLIEEREGRSIPEIFESVGESGFRAIEAEVIRDALEDFDGVLSLGGGAVVTAATRDILQDYPVFLIDVDNEELVRRLTSSSIVRPLVAQDPSGRVATLRREREDLYRRSARYTVYSDGRPARRVARQVLAILDNIPHIVVEVAGEPQGYDVVVGTGLGQDLKIAAQDYSQVLIAYSPDVEKVARSAQEILRVSHEVNTFALPDDEEAKSFETIVKLWDYLAQVRLGRDGVIVAVGGGAVTDAVGFAASTWLRGVPVINVPTTLLGMIDVAIGGKTGINTSAGKNLVGSFFSPAEVLVDLTHLEGLPHHQYASGMAEAIKAGFIADRRILEILRETGQEIFDSTSGALRQVIERSIRVKAEIVSHDHREAGRREVLNYGHTLGHAIEVDDPTVLHGEAVAIGCVFAASLAEVMGIAEPGWASTHREFFSRVGLKTTYPQGNKEKLFSLMRADKKVRDHKLRFVVLSDVGKPQVVCEPSWEQLELAFAAVGL